MSTLDQAESNKMVAEEIIEKNTAKTRVESSRSLLEWSIHDFDVLFPNEAEIGNTESEMNEFFSTFKTLRSPTFMTHFGQKEGTKSEQKWFVELDVNPKSGANAPAPNIERYVSLILHYQPSDNCQIEPSSLIVSFYLLGEENTELKVPFVETFERVKTTGLGNARLISLKKLWKNSNITLVNNILRIGVEVRVFGSTSTEMTDSGYFGCYPSSGTEILVDNLRQLFKSGKGADLTINCGGKDFPIHSSILKGRCVVFERMLESGMKESEAKIIKIVDTDPTIFEPFLEYIYTAQINLESMEKAFGVVRVADMYGIKELKTLCFRFIVDHISFKNAADIAVLTYQHNAGEKLRSKVVNFCHKNWYELAKLSTFKECVSGNPLAFLKDMQQGK